MTLAAAKILVVDDNDALRSLLVSQLQEDFVVAAAGTASEAIQLAQSPGAGAYAAIVCDWHLPDASGVALVEQIRRSHPGVKAVFISGAVDVEAQALAIGDAAFLAKPFRLHELQAALRDLIGPHMDSTS